MTIYIDNNYRCYTFDDGTRRQFESDFFDGKCRAFIEGYRFVPNGEMWTRKDGVRFQGKLIAPAVPYEELKPYQKQYEEDQEILNIITGEVSADDES